MFTTRLGLLLVPILALVVAQGVPLEAADGVGATMGCWSNAQAFEGFSQASEIVSKRTLTAKHFSNEDGTCSAVISCVPVHYLADNRWYDIDRRIQESGEGSEYAFYNTANTFQSYFPADSAGGAGLKLSYEGADLVHWLDVRLSWSDASGVEHRVGGIGAADARVDGSRIVFEGCFAGVDVEFAVTNVGLVRTIVFKDVPDCIVGAEEGSWLNIVERVVLPAGYGLWVGGKSESGDFAAAGGVEIRDGAGASFISMGPLTISEGSGEGWCGVRRGRQWFRLVGDGVECYRQIPVGCFGWADGASAQEWQGDGGGYSLRATVLLRPTVAAWWTGWMDPAWFHDAHNNYGCGDADIIVGTPDLEPPFYEYRGWAKFDVSSIDGEVTDSDLDIHAFQSLWEKGMYVDYYSIDDVDPQYAHFTDANVQLLYADCQNGTQYYNNKWWPTYGWVGSVDLGAAADDDIENPWAGTGWWAVGFSSNTPVGGEPPEVGEAIKGSGYNAGDEAPKLTVTYTPACTPPTITSGATGGGTVIEGDPGPVTFSVTATGDPAPTYQWKRDGLDVSDEAGHIQGATTDTLTITNVELSDDGDYTCVATNPCGEDTSDAATLTVLAIGDLDCNGSINGLDIDPFVLALTSTPPDYPEYYAQHAGCEVMLADCNGDGTINGLDIDPFVAVLTGG